MAAELLEYVLDLFSLVITAASPFMMTTSRRAAQAPKRHAGPTLAEVGRIHQLTLQSENRAESTRVWYALVIARFEAFCELGELEAPILLSALTVDAARRFIIYLQTTDLHTAPESRHTGLIGSRTIHEHTRALKTFTRWCVDQDLLDYDPLQKLKLPKAPKPIFPLFTGEDIERLLLVIAEGREQVRDRAMFLFMLSTGVRVSELCRLKVGDVDLARKRAKVFGKGSKERMVSLDAAAARAVIHYLAERDGRNKQRRPEMFLTTRAGTMKRDHVYHLMVNWGKLSGVSDHVRCSPHTLRHTFATCFLRAHPGALFHLQQLLGHEDLETVQIYARLAEGESIIEGATVLETLGVRGTRWR